MAARPGDIDPRQARINALDDEIAELERQLARGYSWFTAFGLNKRREERDDLAAALKRERLERKGGR